MLAVVPKNSASLSWRLTNNEIQTGLTFQKCSEVSDLNGVARSTLSPEFGIFECDIKAFHKFWKGLRFLRFKFNKAKTFSVNLLNELELAGIKQPDQLIKLKMALKVLASC